MKPTKKSPRHTCLALAWVLVGAACTTAHASETGRIVEALALREGMRVADVGAGDGEWTERLAEEVGESGHVFATEVDEDDLEKVERRTSDLDNVTTVLGTSRDTGLPEGCCEAILLRLVYHHFTEPLPMRASLWRALRPQARLVVIDTLPQVSWPRLDGVPDRGGHGILEEDLVREMTSDGFEVVARHEQWNGNSDRFCVVFRRADGGLGSSETR
jgi:ubiquinone/menaquinone biosynthesis C-methylase UbiE